MTDDRDREIYDYLDGRLSKSQRDIFEARIAEDSELAEHLNDIRSHEAALNEAFPRHTFADPRIPQPQQSNTSLRWYAAAAGILLFVGFSWAAVETGLWPAITDYFGGDSNISVNATDTGPDRGDTDRNSTIVDDSHADSIDTTPQTEESDDTASNPIVETAAIDRGQLQGHVFDPNGDAIVGAKVTVSDSYSGDPVYTARTDDEGWFESELLSDGYVKVSAKGYSAIDYYPLPDAERVEIDWTLAPLAAMHGIVLSIDGEPVEGAKVFPQKLYYADTFSTSGPDGRFTLQAATHWSLDGEVPIEIYHPDYAPLNAIWYGGEDPQPYWVGKGGKISIAVFQNGAPVPGAKVYAGNQEDRPENPIQAVTGEAGIAILGPLPQGSEPRITTELPDGRKSVGLDMPVRIEAGKTVESSVSFGVNPMNRISGRVVNARTGDPIVDVYVHLSTGDSSGSRTMNVPTDDRGEFSVAIEGADIGVMARTRDEDGSQLHAYETVRFASPPSQQYIELRLEPTAIPKYRFEDASIGGSSSVWMGEALVTGLRFDEEGFVEHRPHHNLYFTENQEWAGFPVPIDLHKGRIRFDLETTSGVTGRYIDNVGDPIPNARGILSFRGSNFDVTVGEQTVRPNHSVQILTDNNGEFETGPLLADGRYDLYAGAAGYASTEASRVQDIVPRATTGLGTKVLLKRDSYLEGTIEYDTGGLARSTELILTHESGFKMYVQVPFGRFKVPVPRGNYDLVVNIPPANGQGFAQATAPGPALKLSVPNPMFEFDIGDPATAEDIKAQQNNLRQMAIVFKMFAGENKDEFPTLSTTYGQFAPDLQQLYPEYLTDLSVMNNLLGNSTTRAAYLGYAIMDEAAGLAFLEAYETYGPAGLAGNDLDLNEDVGSNGPPTIFRLRDGIERLFITDINNPRAANSAESSIPVIFEIPTDRGGRGGLVLYMDGHVEWVKYPGRFPMTEAFIQRIESIMAPKPGEQDAP